VGRGAELGLGGDASERVFESDLEGVRQLEVLDVPTVRADPWW
jgi:hypothetical protein